MKKLLEIIDIDEKQDLCLQERCKTFANQARSEDGCLINMIDYTMLIPLSQQYRHSNIKATQAQTL